GIDLDVKAVELAVAVPREVNRGLAQGLAGEGPRVHRGAAWLGRALDDRDLLAEVRGLHRAFFASGARAEDDQVVIESRHPWEATTLPLSRVRRSQPPNRPWCPRPTTAERSGC